MVTKREMSWRNFESDVEEVDFMSTYQLIKEKDSKGKETVVGRYWEKDET